MVLERTAGLRFSPFAALSPAAAEFWCYPSVPRPGSAPARRLHFLQRLGHIAELGQAHVELVQR